MVEPTKLEMLVAEITGTAESDQIGVYKQIPFRVRIDLMARLEALNDMKSATRKTSRNNLLNDLLDIAMTQVVSQLDEDAQQHLAELESRIYEHLEQFLAGESE